MKILTFFATIFMFLVPTLNTCSGGSAELSAEADTKTVAADTTTTIDVHFVDSAPDMFILANNGTCDLGKSLFFVDFSNTAGQLYFDTDAADGGAHMPAPFVAAHGQLALVEGSVHDGDHSLMVQIAELGAGESAIFTIDVDGADHYRVSSATINGGVVGIVDSANDALYRAVFENDTLTSLPVACHQ